LANAYRRFVYAVDLHLGYERRGGHKIPLHDPKAWGAFLAFCQHFKPNAVILGGDMLDCGAVSHHNRKKHRQTEGLRILADAVELNREVLAPLKALGADRYVYIPGNHEDWLEDLMEEDPALDGLLALDHLLDLRGWEVPEFDSDKVVHEGKIHFIHGHQVKGGEHVAKNAVIAYERNIRFGHHHTYQLYTKNSALDARHPKTGVAVPCLCARGPKYGEGSPNRWVQGFNFGEVDPGGNFTDYVAIVTDGKTVWNGKTFKG
jgi:hypothetical protein